MAKAFMIMGSMALIFFMLVFALAGRTVETAAKDAAGCSLSTRIDFLRINDEVQACYAGSSLYFAVENLGSDTLSGLSVYLESDYNLTMLVKGSILPGSAKQQSLNLGAQSIANPNSIVLYPVVGDSRDVCRDAGIRTELAEC
jgi:hypothetical protein